MFSVRRMGSLVVIVLSAVALAPIAPSPARGASDPVTEAKRKAANDLMRDGKTGDAIALLQEVMRADPNQYKDHLMLARAYDKQNKPEEALEAYRRVLDLPGGADDRAVKMEVERRLKVLDGQSAKIQAAEDEFMKRLDALEREAVAARDMRALSRVFALKGGVWNARGRKDGGGAEVAAANEWVETNMVVHKGRRYRVRAAGTWGIFGGSQCTADGLPNGPTNGQGALGTLLGAIDTAPGFIPLGTDRTFVAAATGRLRLISNMNTAADRAKNTGRIYVLIEPE
jgi:hypothetical protein